MAIQLNQNSPRPKQTEELLSLGLNFGAEYTVHWSQTFSGQWDLKDCKSRKVVLTLKAWQVDSLLKNRVLVPKPFLSK